MKIQGRRKLPSRIRRLAIVRAREQISNLWLGGMRYAGDVCQFIWNDTPEGWMYWYEVYQNNNWSHESNISLKWNTVDYSRRLVKAHNMVKRLYMFYKYM